MKRFEADWERWGRAAGPLRNQEMLEYVTPGGHLVALWDGYSRGTQHVIECARRRGLGVTVLR